MSPSAFVRSLASARDDRKNCSVVVRACSSHSTKQFSEDSPETAARPIRLHGLGVFDQADGGGELRILKRGSQSGHGLRVRDMGRHLEDFLREMIDAIEQAASAGDENSGSGEIDERFFLQFAFEELQTFAQAHMDDGVQSLAFDFFAGKTGIVLQENCLAGQTISKSDTAFLGL